jgi:hypothetical protein
MAKEAALAFIVMVILRVYNAYKPDFAFKPKPLRRLTRTLSA